MVLLKLGKEVSLLLWINVKSFIHKILIFYLLNPNRPLGILSRVSRVSFKLELDGTRPYKETDSDETSVGNDHLLNELSVTFSVCVNEDQDKLPTMYWLPKLHKRPYKARFNANSSSCTTTELSKLLTSYLTAIKSHVIRYCDTV